MKRNGYIALMTVLIMSLILAGMTANVASSGFYARMHILDAESAEAARAFARGCSDHAVAALIVDPSYRGDTTTTEDALTCYVLPVGLEARDTQTMRATIRVRAQTRNIYVNTVRTVDLHNIHTTPALSSPPRDTPTVTDISYREVPTLP